MYLFFGTISCLDLRAGWHTTHDLHVLDTELFRQERFCVFLSPPKKGNRLLSRNVCELLFGVGLDLWESLLRLLVSGAELLILGIRPVMHHIFIWDSIPGC